MIQLQNNFTTPEQSKRLLGLGVPADSADCFYDTQFFGGQIVQTRMGSGWRISRTLFKSFGIIPCWSVGRLMEIYITCIKHYTGDERLTVGIDTIRLGIMDCIIAAMEVGCDDGDIDFSKLED